MRWVSNAENTGIVAAELERSDGLRERVWTRPFPEFPEAQRGHAR
jgi:hypothetical protein